MKIPTRPLGRTGQEISILGFGTAAAGNRLNLRDALRLYERALSSGVTYFDTAPEFAGYGKAQKQLGHLLKNRRKEIFLVTKCYEPDGDAALRLLEKNLRELQTDHADLVFVHSLGADKMDPKKVFSRRGCYAAMIRAKANGLTRFVGFSGHNRPDRFIKAVKRFKADVLLNAVNFADRHTYDFERTVWPLAEKSGIGLIAMKVFGGQIHSERTRLSHSMMPDRYHDLAFCYALSLPNVASAAIGMATPEELRQNIQRALRFKPLTLLERNRLDTIGRELAKDWGAHLGSVV